MLFISERAKVQGTALAPSLAGDDERVASRRGDVAGQGDLGSLGDSREWFP